MKNIEGIQPRQPIAIARLDDLSEALNLGKAMVAGGIQLLEFTLTNRKALDAVELVRSELGDSLMVGAGTVLDEASARASIMSGAQFLVTPALVPDVIECARRYDVPVMCGAFTPTEILTASQRGADFVKLFPARSIGPSYIKDVLGPLPNVRLIPTGGVGLDNCRAFLDAGAYSVAVGSSLIRKDLVAAGRWDEITELASQYVHACG